MSIMLNKQTALLPIIFNFRPDAQNNEHDCQILNIATRFTGLPSLTSLNAIKEHSAMTTYQPYTYLVGWSLLNKWYYGVRFAKDCRPSDLFETYFTSSNYVKEYYKLHGKPDVIQVRKFFQNIDDARCWEHKVLKRLHAVANDTWLNQTDNKSISYEKGLLGCKIAAQVNKGSLRSKEHCNAIKQALTGRTRPLTVGRKVSATRIRKFAAGELEVTNLDKSIYTFKHPNIGVVVCNRQEFKKMYCNTNQTPNDMFCKNPRPWHKWIVIEKWLEAGLLIN